nr:predicted GPI-anchored protein 58 [Aegilops tauschii subsp. strangulata]
MHVRPRLRHIAPASPRPARASVLRRRPATRSPAWRPPARACIPATPASRPRPTPCQLAGSPPCAPGPRTPAVSASSSAPAAQRRVRPRPLAGFRASRPASVPLVRAPARAPRQAGFRPRRPATRLRLPRLAPPPHPSSRASAYDHDRVPAPPSLRTRRLRSGRLRPRSATQRVVRPCRQQPAPAPCSASTPSLVSSGSPAICAPGPHRLWVATPSPAASDLAPIRPGWLRWPASCRVARSSMRTRTAGSSLRALAGSTRNLACRLRPPRLRRNPACRLRPRRLPRWLAPPQPGRRLPPRPAPIGSSHSGFACPRCSAATGRCCVRKKKMPAERRKRDSG